MNNFLPITRKECDELGWGAPDFVYVSGDAYVDHPSFGTAIITRVLEDAGFRVAVLAQPDYKSCEDFKRFGKPRLGFLVSAGNIDSMVAHYTVSKKKRSYDYYSPSGKMGLRPDRAVIVYCNRIREAYGDVPIIIGGLEASLRRFAHYDYWDNKIRRSILVDSRADILTYGMGESIILKLAKLLDKGVPIKKIRAERGCVYLCKREDEVSFPVAAEFDFNVIKENKEEYARAFGIQYKNQDAIYGKAIVEYYDNKKLDEISIIYTDYIGSKPGECKKITLLPLIQTHFYVGDADTFHTEKEFLPSPDAVLDGIVPSYLMGFIYGCLVESFCSEQQARMTAMKSAGDNAEDMLKILRLQYNKVRQAAITNEMIEITAGVRALKRRHRSALGDMCHEDK